MPGVLKTRMKFELEELKIRLGNGSILNLDHVTSEINRITDTIEKIDREIVDDPEKSALVNGKDLEKEYDESTINFWRGFHEQLPQCGFLERPFSRDVEIICRNGFIKVHRVVLIATSDLFQTIFKKTDEENPVVHLLDWSLNEVKLVIDLLYRGQVLIPSSSIEPIYEILDALKILSPQTNLNLNLSPATAKDLIQVYKFPSYFKETNWLQNSVKLSAPRTRENLTPSSVLNEMCPELEFLYKNRAVLDRNQEAGIVVTTFFELTNKPYLVTDSCKKGAKNKCAAQILDDLGIQVKYQSPPPDLNGTETPWVTKEEEAAGDSKNSEKKETQLPKVEVEAEDESLDSTTASSTSSIDLNSNPNPNQNPSTEISSIDENILKRIGRIRNLEENAFVAIRNLHYPNPTVVEFLPWLCPPNSPRFTCRLLSQNSWFFGAGMSRNEAQSNAALTALTFILSEEEFEALCRTSKRPLVDLKNPPNQPKPIERQKSLTPSPSSSSSSLQNILSGVDIERRIGKIQNLEENAWSALCNLNGSNSTYFEFPRAECPPNSSFFTCRVQFKNYWFSGTGFNEKEAKAKAAFHALCRILGPEKLNVFCERSKTVKMPLKIPPNSAPAKVSESNQPKISLSSSSSSSSSCSSFSLQRNLREPESEPESDSEWHEFLKSIASTHPKTETAAAEDIFSDFVHKLISEKCREMLKQDPDHSRGKVIAGVVMTTGIPLTKTAKIVAVATGSKFIQGKSLSPTGEAIHDCHAEILVTRGLRDFLFKEIVSLIQGNVEKSIFTRQPQLQIQSQSNGNTENTGLKLKDGVEFHLYISTAPCGDARVFVDPFSSESTVDSNPDRRNRGLLRYKIEAGEGTIPAARYPWTFGQSWTKLMGGERLKIMSCSDKICRWNILGVQGALLSHLIPPIYYSSIILGGYHHSQHFQRAVVGRIAELEKIMGFSDKYKVNTPDLVRIYPNCAVFTQETKGPKFAVLWVSYWNSYEVLNTRTGRIKSETRMPPSRVCKRVAFTRFINILKLMKEFSPAFENCSYEEAKLEAKEYQEMKAKFFELMQETNLGSWIRKPREVDAFKIEDSS